MRRRADTQQIKAAQKRLKAHIKNKGTNTDFTLTESFCFYWWHRLNVSIFDGILTPPVRFELKNFRYNMGWCLPWRANSKTPRVSIGINTIIHERKEFLAILGHEMVHQWEWEILHDWSSSVVHGERFFSWKHKFKIRAGLPLEESY